MAPHLARVTKIVSRLPILRPPAAAVLAVLGAKSLLQRSFAMAAANLARPGANLAVLCQESSCAGPLPCILAATVVKAASRGDRSTPSLLAAGLGSVIYRGGSCACQLAIAVLAWICFFAGSLPFFIFKQERYT